MLPNTKATLNKWKQSKLLIEGNFTALNILVPLIYVASIVDAHI